MQLHRLEFAVIGPYAGTVVIDFARLASSGVFLLEGPTGAGKSTIIDAIVFALYGSLAGDSGSTSTDRLHSQHADRTAEPYVDLVFETGAGIHRIRRTPAYDRPKQRGTGTTRQNQSATLWRLATPDDAVGQPMSSRAQEIGAEIPRIVGLDRAQFVQTVVLPQGEFARFLRSPGEDRRALLQSLFGTEIYDRTAAVLADRRRAAAAAVEQADRAVSDALSRFRQASGVESASELDTADIAATIVALAASAAAERSGTSADLESARAALAAAERRSAALDRRALLTERAAGLEADAERVGVARDRLALAERASRVLGVLGGLDASTERLAVRRESYRSDVARHHDLIAAHELEPVLARSAQADGGHDVSEVRADGVQERVRAMRDATAAVRPLVAVSTDIALRIQTLDARDTELLADRGRLDDLVAEVSVRPAERERLVERATTERAAAADHAEASVEFARAQSQRATLSALDRAAAACEIAATTLSDAGARARSALATENHLRERRIAGLAGELGAALVDGEPCPVCGAVEHPTIATPEADHPTPEQIEQAAADRAAADRVLGDASTQHSLRVADRDRLAAELDGLTVEQADASIVAARARVESATSAAARADSADAALVAFDAATEALVAERSTLAESVVTRQSALDADRRRIADDRAAVAEALASLEPYLRDPSPSLGSAVQRVDADAAVLAEISSSADAIAAATADVMARRAEVLRALEAEGFTDASAARDGALDADRAPVLRTLVADHDKVDAIVRAGLQEPDVVAAADDSVESVDLAGVRARVTATEQHLDLASSRATTAGHRAEQTVARAYGVRTAIAARAALAADSRAVVRLADIAAGAPGANPTGITLGTYVLMKRFEDVVAAANGRLRSMFAGRFTLEASDERESGQRARKTGLALAVHDHETDTTRDPRSLSGGETFTASLCLALGLADIVQAESGGVQLGTLFVDEGFGTLDPETLDDVIGQLSALTAGGRQVGIVSHVEELKQRIPDRIEVRRTPSGGSVATTTL
jgi:DNA repair protein SbcC/Rad50